MSKNEWIASENYSVYEHFSASNEDLQWWIASVSAQ